MTRRSICGETNVMQMIGASNLAKAVKDAEDAARQDPVTYAVWKAIRWTCYAAIWDRAPHAARFAREAVEAAAGEDREAALLAELAWQTGRLFEYLESEPSPHAPAREAGGDVRDGPSLDVRTASPSGGAGDNPVIRLFRKWSSPASRKEQPAAGAPQGPGSEIDAETGFADELAAAIDRVLDRKGSLQQSQALGELARKEVHAKRFANAQRIIQFIPEVHVRCGALIRLARASRTIGDRVNAERLLAWAEQDSRQIAAIDDQTQPRYGRSEVLWDIAQLRADMGDVAAGLRTAYAIADLEQRIWRVCDIYRRYLIEPGQSALAPKRLAQLTEFFAEVRAAVASSGDDRDAVLKSLVEQQAAFGELESARRDLEAITDGGHRETARQVVDEMTAKIDVPVETRAPTPTDPATAPSQHESFPRKGAMRMVGRKEYGVRVIDNFHRHDPDEWFEISGFATVAAAREYAIRRVRSSMEQFRKPDTTPDELRRAWASMGEEVIVEGESIGAEHMERFIAEPPQPGECDYLSLEPKGGR
jgi:hypothetical protein